MNNLKASLILYSAISVMMGVALLFPNNTAEFLDIDPGASGFIFTLLGVANIAVAYLFMMAGFNPISSVSVLRFAVIWSALMLVGTVYAIFANYVTWGHVWFVVVIHAIFLLTLLIFYPRHRAET
ncbi:MAG: hypothetical protein FWH51_00070 [Dehalococcoidia bacterium]|nr:hypothetical protein [Dehalococcoidia bacterium]